VNYVLFNLICKPRSLRGFLSECNAVRLAQKFKHYLHGCKRVNIDLMRRASKRSCLYLASLNIYD
jgi:hypothetical protein